MTYRGDTHSGFLDYEECEHDPILVEDRDLPEYCWFYRCRKCGVEYNDPAELEASKPDSADGQS